MFDIGWTEMLVIAIVMIVVVGPKDLPKMLRTFGKTTSKLRVMAGDFRKQFDEALKEAELDDVKGLVDDVRKLNPTNEIRQALNPMQKAAADVRAGLDSAMNPKKPLAPSTPATAALKPMEDPAAAKPAEPAKPMADPQPVAPVATEPLARPELAAPPSDFFPAAVDDKPSPVARAAAPLKNGATHAPAAAKPAKAATAKPAAASKSAAAAKPKTAPVAKAKPAAPPKKPAARSKSA